MNETDPLNPAEIAAFIDGTLSDADRTRVEARLADDPVARHELADAARIVASLPSQPVRNTRRVASLLTIGVAAALAIVLLKPGDTGHGVAQKAAERHGNEDLTRAVEVVSPAGGASVTPDRDTFVWRAVDGASYRLAILDADGRTVLQQTTNDTSFAIPFAMLKNESARYYWSVDAQLPDGSSMTSGMHAFILSPR